MKLVLDETCHWLESCAPVRTLQKSDGSSVLTEIPNSNLKFGRSEIRVVEGDPDQDLIRSGLCLNREDPSGADQLWL